MHWRLNLYSSEIIQKRLYQAKKAGIQHERLPRDRSLEIAAKLERLRRDDKGGVLPPGQLSRPLDVKEQSFIESERLLCKADFAYYAERYHAIGIDTGTTDGDLTIGPVRHQESQQKCLKEMGKREAEVYAEHAKYGLTEGIRIIAHKTRQVYFTAFFREVTLHRMLFWPGTRAFAGALNPDGVGELYKRDKLAIDNLPWWLKPDVYPDVKDSELGFKDPLSSRLLYQAENQKAGIAVGTQQDVSHLTEVPLWLFPEQNIGFSLKAALPKSRMTLHVQEGTSAGKGGYWNTVSEAARHRRDGYESWTYIFIPWWLNRRKYRAIPPPNWKPDKHTLEHAELVERTSAEWNEGVTYRPTIEQLVWWQTERAQYILNGSLAFFLASYPCSPEQSFVNFSQGALPVELVEELELGLRKPMLYGVEVQA